MKKTKFVELWDKFALQWCEFETIEVGKEIHKISEFCKIREDYVDMIYERYEGIKRVTKQLYFNDEQKRVNRFKRAAIIMYAINVSEPLVYADEYSEEYMLQKGFFLKQQLALYMAIHSIIMQYPEEKVMSEVSPVSPIYDFNIVSHGVGDKSSDTFKECIYKDLYFSGIYMNFNILTMANMLAV